MPVVRQYADPMGAEMMRRRSLLQAGFAGTAALIAPSLVAYAASPQMLVYKSPWCGCCGAWVEHIRAAGFAVSVKEVGDLAPIKHRAGVGSDVESCHTALIDGYVVEGHVPAREIRRLLVERPLALGLAVPGMPVGSPGMEQGAQRERYDVVLFSPTGRSVFAQY